MASDLKFTKSQVDTKGVEVFDHFAAIGDIQNFRQVGKLILEHSQSAKIRQYVRKKLKEVILSFMSFALVDEDGSEVALDTSLVNAYYISLH